MFCVATGDIGKRIREAREGFRGVGLKQVDLAQRVGISRAMLSNWENGLNDPRDMSVVDRIAKILEVPVGQIKGEIKASPAGTKVSEGRLVSLAGTPLVPVPIIGRASAGPGLSNVDIDAEMVFVPDRLAQIGTLGWIIDGESMMPALQPGDTVLFREFRTAKRGFPFLLRTREGEMRVKIMEWADGEWVLKSLNPTFPTEPMRDHELLGILVGWYRCQGRRETLDSDPDGLRLD